MYIKETITELSHEVAKLKKRCQISEEKLEAFGDLAQRLKISEQKLEKLTTELSQVTSQLVSTKSALEDLIEEKRIRRQRDNADKKLQELRKKIVFRSIPAIETGGKTGKTTMGSSGAKVSSAAETQGARAEDLNQQRATSQSKSQVSHVMVINKVKDKDSENRKILTSGSRGLHLSENCRPSTSPQKSVPTIPDKEKKETAKCDKPDGARGRGTHEFEGNAISVIVVNNKIEKPSSRDALTGKNEHRAGADLPDNPRGEPKSKKPRISTAESDQKLVPNIESIMKELEAHACNLCTNTYRTELGLRVHKAQSHSVTNTTGNKFQCSKCEKSYSSERGLNRHYRIEHSGSNATQNTFDCSYCGKKFRYKYRVRLHEQIHTGERPYPCDVCKKAFISMSKLTEHAKTHLTKLHVNSSATTKDEDDSMSNMTSFTCSTCKSEFKYAASLRLHHIRCICKPKT